LGRLPPWLDELIDVVATRGRTLGGTLRHVPENIGGSPAWYLLLNLSVNSLGYSRFSARLPAAIFSILSCLAITWLARRLRIGWVTAALFSFMLLPLQFRYAIEGRPYSQVLFFSILCTAFAWQLGQKPGIRWTFVYFLVLLAGVYSSPLLFSMAAAHLLWAAFARESADRRRVLVCLGAATVVAALLYLPWYLHSESAWRQGIAANRWSFDFAPRTPLMLLREIGGGGYWVSIPLLAAAGVGLAAGRLDRSAKLLLVFCTALPVAGAVAADAAFGYFIAIRQMIPAVTGLILLSAEGFRAIEERRRVLGMGAMAFLLGAALVHDVKWFSRPRENWQLAASALASTGGCVVYLPEGSSALYRLFEPGLPAASCAPVGQLSEGGRVTLAISPYARREEVAPALRRLASAGMVQAQAVAKGGVLIRTFVPGQAAGATSDMGGPGAK
jgi:uncharacterized membrane protein